jgi:hypothetical protein
VLKSKLVESGEGIGTGQKTTPSGQENLSEAESDEDSDVVSESVKNPESTNTVGNSTSQNSAGNLVAVKSTGISGEEESTENPGTKKSIGNPEAKESTGNPEAKESTGNPEAKESTGNPEEKESVRKLVVVESVGKPGASESSEKPAVKESGGNPVTIESTGNSGNIKDSETVLESVEIPNSMESTGNLGGVMDSGGISGILSSVVKSPDGGSLKESLGSQESVGKPVGEQNPDEPHKQVNPVESVADKAKVPEGVTLLKELIKYAPMSVLNTCLNQPGNAYFLTDSPWATELAKDYLLRLSRESKSV